MGETSTRLEPPVGRRDRDAAYVANERTIMPVRDASGSMKPAFKSVPKTPVSQKSASGDEKAAAAIEVAPSCQGEDVSLSGRSALTRLRAGPQSQGHSQRITWRPSMFSRF
jgi:hypothetical protein